MKNDLERNQTGPVALSASNLWRDYALLDSGGLQKLERFGALTLQRPEPQAVWAPLWDESRWKQKAHAVFESGPHFRGDWRLNPTPETRAILTDKRWPLAYQGRSFRFQLYLSLTSFKNIGVFPEQAVNWEFIYQETRKRNAPKILNLFAYTGGATLAALLAGGSVTHVDALKSVVQWAAENFALNQQDKARRIIDDALKFVKRERRRGARYQGLILDPPAAGNGPGGEKWSFETDVHELIQETAGLLDPEGGFWVFNSYSLGHSALALENLTRDAFPPAYLANLTPGELVLTEEAGGRRLPAGVFTRFAFEKK